jgi:hypothetical protein
MKLDVGEYDPDTDSIVIEGIQYSGTLFRGLGIHGVAEGSLVRIIKRDNGVVWLQNVTAHDFPSLRDH